MLKDGYVFWQARNGVWLSENIPPKYLSIEKQQKEQERIESNMLPGKIDIIFGISGIISLFILMMILGALPIIYGILSISLIITLMITLKIKKLL